MRMIVFLRVRFLWVRVHYGVAKERMPYRAFEVPDVADEFDARALLKTPKTVIGMAGGALSGRLEFRVEDGEEPASELRVYTGGGEQKMLGKMVMVCTVWA